MSFKYINSCTDTKVDMIHKLNTGLESYLVSTVALSLT